MLAGDHTQDYQKLQNLAQQSGFALPTAIDTDHNKSLITPLHGLKGKAFDHTYIQDMVAGHTQALALYKKEAHDATNPTIRSYAQNTIPTCRRARPSEGWKTAWTAGAPALVRYSVRSVELTWT